MEGVSPIFTPIKTGAGGKGGRTVSNQSKIGQLIPIRGAHHIDAPDREDVAPRDVDRLCDVQVRCHGRPPGPRGDRGEPHPRRG